MLDGRIALDLSLSWIAERRQPVDPRLFALLEAIHDTGKLTDATAKLGIPYRQAWGLIAKWSEIIGHPLVVKQKGRGTHLTPFGDRLLSLKEQINARLMPHLERAMLEVEQQIGGILGGQEPALSIHAGRDLALAAVRDYLRTHPGPKLDVRFINSPDSVKSLSMARCDVAGFHVPDGALGAGIVALYRPWLKPRSHRLIHFVRRRQGLIVAAGNPKRIRTLADIADTRARFINRQRGSGTRLAVEQLLKQQGIREASIAGFDSEEETHVAIAAAVAGGTADVGIGIEAAARRLRLEFIPLFSEAYSLLVRKETLMQDGLQALLAFLQNDVFRQLIAAIPGYDGSGAGTMRTIDALL